MSNYIYMISNQKESFVETIMELVYSQENAAEIRVLPNAYTEMDKLFRYDERDHSMVEIKDFYNYTFE